jgi:formylglycine-generating enzyme required for sulfatase activity
MAYLYQKMFLLTVCLGLAACGKNPAEADKNARASSPAVKAASVANAQKQAPQKIFKKQLPIPAVDAGTTKQALINADNAFVQGKLDGLLTQEPAALEWYLAVLSLHADEAQAKIGLQKVLQSLLQKGLLAQRQGDIEQAQHIAEVFNLSSTSFPEADAYLQQMPAVLKAEEWYQQGRRSEADKQVFIGADPKVAVSAVGAYQTALHHWPQYQPAIDALSRLRIEQQNIAKTSAAASKFDVALLALEKAKKINPKNPDFLRTALQVRGQLHQGLSYEVTLANLALDGLRFTPAQQHYEKALALSATDISVKQLAKRMDDVKHYGRFKAGRVFTDPWAMSNPAPEMVVIPYGRFRMGRDIEQTSSKFETPAHEVVFLRGFAIARSEITIAQFKEFIDNTAYQTRADKRGYSIVFDEKGGSLMQKEKINWRHDHLGRVANPSLPVVHVSLHDAQAYASWLSKKTGQVYRLPSEAEFEYVQAAGSVSNYAWGDALPKKSIANLAGAGDKSTQSRSFGNAIEGYRDFYWGAAPVRSFPVERWGSFDMTGNVAEWVEDCWHESYQRAPVDGSAWVNTGCTEGVVRGGSWGSSLEQARISFRMSAARKDHTAQIGFRVVRVL